jgi:hypothetical protein
MTTSKSRLARFRKLPSSLISRAKVRNGSPYNLAMDASDAVIADVSQPENAKLRARGRPTKPHPAIRTDLGIALPLNWTSDCPDGTGH